MKKDIHELKVEFVCLCVCVRVCVFVCERKKFSSFKIALIILRHKKCKSPIPIGF